MSVTSESLEVRRPATSDELVRIGSREQLLADIARAVQPGVSPQALVLLALDGFREFHDRVGPLESRTLLAELAERLEEAVASAGSCYRARDDEFAVLCDAECAALEPLVDQAAATLREPGLRVSVGVVWGSVVLPDEASDPVGALRLADQRLAANRPMRRAGQPPTLSLDPDDPLVAIHGEIAEASAAALKMKQVDQLLDVATTLAQLAEAVRVDDHSEGRLRGPREPARIPILLKELGLKLAALQAFGGPELDQAIKLAAEPNAPFSSMPPKVLAALDQIGFVLSAG
jgi:GGDEF domain-containing protein